jgi:tRNA uridine 5-carboxymethylaminomethyl modification enzyme
VGPVRARAFAAKARALDAARAALAAAAATPDALAAQGIQVNRDGVRRTCHQALAYPGATVRRLAALWPELAGMAPAVAEQMEIEARYAGYLERQVADVRAFRRDDSLEFPPDLDFAAVPGLSAEVRQKLVRARPATIGAAARISGVTPAALVTLLGHARRRPDRLIA